MLHSLRHVNKLLIFALIFTLAVSLSGCDKSKKQAQKGAVKETIFTAKEHSTTTQLYYKGTLAPIRSIPVVSPIDGLVVKLLAAYGEVVKKKEGLVVLNATRLATDYRTAVSDFLQKKAALETQKTTYAGDKQLYQAGVMSKEDFENAENTYATSVLNFSQARLNLQKVLMRAGITPQTIEKLSLGETKAVDKIMQRSFSRVKVASPADGVLLIPVESKDSSGAKVGGKLTVGAKVTASQPILTVGDLTGYKLAIQISELNITEVKPGLRAFITGQAFPGLTLQGKVSQVAVQADPNAGGGGAVSMFSATVRVPNVSPAARKKIRVGMTAKIEIQIANPAKILVPINAVQVKGNKMFVTVIDKNGRRKDVEVQTGSTTMTEVAIISGIKAGDKVVVMTRVKTNAKAG